MDIIKRNTFILHRRNFCVSFITRISTTQIFFLCKECLNDSDESRSITFMQSSVDLRLIISYSCVITGGVGRIVTPLQYLNCERFVILSGRLVFFASLRRLPQDAAAIFCRRFLHNSVRCDV